MKHEIGENVQFVVTECMRSQTLNRSKVVNPDRKLAEREKNVFFGGRIADYQYYDMDQVIGLALKAIKAMCNRFRHGYCCRSGATLLGATVSPINGEIRKGASACPSRCSLAATRADAAIQDRHGRAAGSRHRGELG